MVNQLKVITKEIPIAEELKTRIQFICDFCNTTPTFINGSIRKVEKTNINYIEETVVFRLYQILLTPLFL